MRELYRLLVAKDKKEYWTKIFSVIYENEDGFHEKQVNCRDLITGEILGYEQLIN